VLDLIYRTGEVADLLGLIRESDHKKLILRVCGFEKLNHRLFRPLDFADHATAAIEDHAQRNWSILAGERADLLRAITFEKLEVFLVETGPQPVQGVGDSHRNQHQLDIHLQRAYMRG